MAAASYTHYGPLDSVAVRSVDRPRPGADEVLIRVRSAALHVGDCFSVRGTPLLMRAYTGLLRPRYGVPGFDFAGVVEAVGDSVTKVAPGDRVVATRERAGGCAEYAVALSDELVALPDEVSFDHAAAVPTSGLAALHALRDVAQLQPGQRVLINGASGGVGCFAVQIARHLGASVTAVCSERNASWVSELGADEVIDYGSSDFTELGPVFDVVFDNVENRSLRDCRKVLRPNGTLILNSGTGASGLRMFWRLVHPLVLNPFVDHSLRRYLSVPNPEDLAHLVELLQTGVVVAPVHDTFALDDTVAALQLIASGRARGKTVIHVDG